MLSVNYIAIKQGGGQDSSAGLSVLRTCQGALGGGAGGEELWFPFCLQGRCSEGAEEGWRGGAEMGGKGLGGVGPGGKRWRSGEDSSLPGWEAEREAVAGLSELVLLAGSPNLFGFSSPQVEPLDLGLSLDLA